MEAAKPILVTGASGFLGAAIVRQLAKEGIPLRAMLRKSSSRELLAGIDENQIITADMSDPDSLRQAAQGTCAVIHCAAVVSTAAPDIALSRKINVEGTRHLLTACEKEGVERFILIGSQSAHPKNPSAYGSTKYEQQLLVQEWTAGDWTILKPSIIYGAEARGIFDKMVNLCRKLPIVPVPAPRGEMRPVLADDVARAAIACLQHKKTASKVYDIGGADVLSFHEFIRAILRALGQKKWTLPIPAPIAMAIARTFSLVMKNPPIAPDNVTGIAQAPHVNISNAKEDFGFHPLAFAEGLEKIWNQKTMKATPRVQPPAARVIIIGLGKMGVMHASMCQNTPGIEPVGLVDQDLGLGKQLQGMGLDIPCAANLEEILEKAAPIHAAIIATPQFTHREIGLACLEKGLHVFSEKPLAHKLQDAIDMARAAAKRPSQVTATGFMKGHLTMWRHAAQCLQNGWIGRPRRFHASVYLSQVMAPPKGWTFTKDQAGGGILINSGIHLIHYLRVLFGDANRVCACATPLHGEVEDTIAALLEFENGVFGSYNATWSVPGHSTESTTILIEAEQGILEITDDALRFHHFKGSDNLAQGWTQRHRAEFEKAAFNLSPDYGGEGYYNQTADFARAIAENKKPLYDWTEGLRVQEIIDALYRSAEARQPVPIQKNGV